MLIIAEKLEVLRPIAAESQQAGRRAEDLKRKAGLKLNAGAMLAFKIILYI